MNLPDMTGYDVLRRLRAAPETAAIPVLALSADAMPRDISRGEAAGFYKYMTKPFVVPDMVTVLSELIERRTV
jgi:CheY-like chemotaxis protein